MSDETRVAPASVPGAECRINALHDNLLLIILSNLPVRQVVQTCVLSRRWRNLWRSVSRVIISPDDFDAMVDTPKERAVLFKKFVNRFLMLRNPSALDELQLYYNMPTYDLDADSEDANLWIRHALECNAQSVKVEIRHQLLHLVPTVFASGRFLARLHLSSVDLSYGFFRQLETSCKSLKQLFLDDCCIYDAEITSNTLKVLTIDMNCRFMFVKQPSISIPSLVYFSFSMEDGKKIPFLKNMESLETAYASLNTYDDIEDDDIRQFLKGLSGVTDLNFSYNGTMPEMENNAQWCPEFNNLTTLRLDNCCVYPGFNPLIVFLRNSPKLESLTLKLSFSGDAHIHPRLEGRLFSCVDLHRIDITICQAVRKDHPTLVSLEKLLTYNGIDSLSCYSQRSSPPALQPCENNVQAAAASSSSSMTRAPPLPDSSATAQAPPPPFHGGVAFLISLSVTTSWRVDLLSTHNSSARPTPYTFYCTSVAKNVLLGGQSYACWTWREWRQTVGIRVLLACSNYKDCEYIRFEISTLEVLASGT
ncbi:hypothetical protein U9M48_008231 [Paspalum notatum var. saurae]|uniref:F-box domain-containing protein n=1 Tax=Paspalum notatum var. saurae TaxID=547442 RepID=A0AAQ3WDA1_PASNO